MQRRTDRTARVLRELQALLGHDCEREAIARLRARTRRSWGWFEPLLGLLDERPTSSRRAALASARTSSAC